MATVAAASPSMPFINVPVSNVHARTIGTSDLPKHKIYDGKLDIVLDFWTQYPKYLFQTLRYSTEAAGVCFSSLREVPSFTRALHGLKQGTLMMTWYDEVKSFAAFRKTLGDFVFQPADGHAPTFMKLFEDSCDLVSKTCEVFRWFVESKIVMISAGLANNMLLLNGVTMMFSFSRKVSAELEKLNKSAVHERSLCLWKIAKHVSLFAIGVILTYGAFYGLYYPYILACSIVSLVANYAQTLIEKSSYEVKAGEWTQENSARFQFFRHNEAPRGDGRFDCTISYPVTPRPVAQATA